jgi:hypothetical protein
MELAITSIVNTYVRYGNLGALHELWRIRNNLKIRMLELPGGYDPGQLMAKLNSEIAVIETGIEKLSPAAGA